MKQFLMCILAVFLLTACSGSSASSQPEGGGSRDSTPVVRTPEASGTASTEKEDSALDYSHADEGYVMARLGSGTGKFLLETPDGTTYTWSLPEGEWQTFPLTGGDGEYTCRIYKNVRGEQYAQTLSASVSVTLADSFGPFLCPNQFVWFTADSQTVAKGAELAESADDDLGVITSVYNYITQNITYDTAKAEQIEDGYIPDADETLESGTGICFDYAAVMAAMLRSQNIPTRLEVGYAGSVYHAWISTWIDEKGWVNGIIEFNGTDWELMDPTFAASRTEKELKKFISDGDNYTTMYVY